MQKNKLCTSIVFAWLVLCSWMAGNVWAAAYFQLESAENWQMALDEGRIQAMTESQWEGYMEQWRNTTGSEPYPENIFMPPRLYVMEGNDTSLEGPGLVMMWAAPVDSPGLVQSLSSAFLYDYGLDPDLSNSTITITVKAPRFDLNGNQINAVSLGIRDVNGRIRAWYWLVGPAAAPIPWNVPTQITIDTSIPGIGAATPLANGFTTHPLFDITQSQCIIFDENARWVGGSAPIPPPGQVDPMPWNYWRNLMVSPNRHPFLIVGLNPDIHQGVANLANDFHMEGRIESGPDELNWAVPPVLVTHIDGGFPQFEYTIEPDPTAPGQNWYLVKARWWGREVPYCNTIHLGLFFRVACHNIVVDMKGWWTLNGQKLGEVPILGFDVQDQIVVPPTPGPEPADPLPPQDSMPQAIRTQNASGLETEIIAMQLAVLESEDQMNEWLGPEPFQELRDGGRQEELPWLPVIQPNGAEVDTQNPVMLPPGGEVVVTLNFDPSQPQPGFHPIAPIVIPPGGLLLARNLISMEDQYGIRTYHWIFHIHGAHHYRFGELGDAPDSSNSFGARMTAYPWGVMANYPTVYRIGSPPHGPFHWFPCYVAHLGHAVTWEWEADLLPDQDPTTNLIPPVNTADRDRADDGILHMPLKLPHCRPVTFKYQVNKTTNANVKLFVNVWVDWNRDGDFDDNLTCQTGVSAPEWAVQDQVLAGLSPGMNTITTPPLVPWHPVISADNKVPPLWLRITLAERPWPFGPAGVTPPGFGGAGPWFGYRIGETEDYYFTPKPCPCTTCPDLNCDGIVDLGDFAIFAKWWLTECP